MKEIFNADDYATMFAYLVIIERKETKRLDINKEILDYLVSHLQNEIKKDSKSILDIKLLEEKVYEFVVNVENSIALFSIFVFIDTLEYKKETKDALNSIILEKVIFSGTHTTEELVIAFNEFISKINFIDPQEFDKAISKAQERLSYSGKTLQEQLYIIEPILIAYYKSDKNRECVQKILDEFNMQNK